MTVFDRPDASAGTPAVELDNRQALAVAVALHQRGQLDAAETVYRSVLRLAPEDADATHFLGMLLHQRRRHDEALALLRRSIALDPSVAGWHNNLGNALLDAGDLDGATACYERCQALDADEVEALNNLGVLRRFQGRLDDAGRHFGEALRRRPDFADAHANLAVVLYQQGRIDEGHAHSAEALRLRPTHRSARRALGVLYAQLGRLEEAREVYRDWLRHEPGSVHARHYLAACGGESMPERASDGYIESEFDAFAASFDARLAELEYRAPALVGELVARLLGAPAPTRRIVDAGAGTGLCGPSLAPYAARLVGVDLSGAMLQRAAARGLYHALERAELVAWLRAHPGTADLVVSADTLCYFGPLEPVFSATRQALSDGGLLVFTVEANDEAGGDVRLHPHGRYSHGAGYLRRGLQDAGFELLHLDPVTLRSEGGRPVAGWLVAARAAS